MSKPHLIIRNHSLRPSAGLRDSSPVNRQALRLPLPIDHLRKLLQRTASSLRKPGYAIVGALWVVNIESIRLAALPFNGLFAILAGGRLRPAEQPRSFNWSQKKQGPMYGCGSFTNIGPSAHSSASVFLGTGIRSGSDLQDFRRTVLLYHRIPHRQVLQLK